jgi:hypothetical protein
LKTIASRGALPGALTSLINKQNIIVYTRGMTEPTEHNPNPSLSQETALRRFIPCTLDTSLPDPYFSPFKI